jgi:hypothetical protein
MNPKQTTPPLVLRSARGEGTPLPLALAGMPKEIEGRVCHYRRKELAPVCTFVHRGTGRTETISRKRILAWVDAFKRRLAKGIKVPVTDLHTLTPRASDTFGYVVGLSVSGDSLYADLQLIGDDALTLAARTDISLCAVSDALDGDGEKYDECLHHVALTPTPALTNLGGYVKIAASASPFADNPVFEPSSGSYTPKGASMPFQFDQELGRKLREKLSLGADVPDEQVAVVAAEHVTAAIEVQGRAEQDRRQITALSADVSRLRNELATANEKVTALSADAPKELDGRTLSLMRRQFKSDRERVIASGVISEAGMQKIDELLGVNQANGLALSLSAGEGEETDMVYSRICEIIATHPGIKTNGAIQRSKPGNLSLSANNDPNAPVSDERYRELMALTGAGQAVLDARK